MNANAVPMSADPSAARHAPAAGTMTAHMCWHCGADQRLMQVCAKCSLARYCSTECARAHKKTGHAPICAALASVYGAWQSLLAVSRASVAADRTTLVAELVAAGLRQMAYEVDATDSESSKESE